MINPRLYTASVLSRRSSTLFFTPSIALVCLFQMPLAPISAFPSQEPSQTSAQENGDQTIVLEPGKPVERVLQGGEKHTYKIHADAGLFLHAVVEQLGIDVVLRLYAADGKKIASMNSPNRSLGPEQISTIAESSGTYRLEVASGDKSAPAGRYRVTIDPLRAPRDEDRGRITAERLCYVAMKLWQHGTVNLYRVALQKFGETLPLWRAAGDSYEEALTLRSIGSIHARLGEKQKALEYYNQALPLERAVGDSSGEARTLNYIGVVYDDLGEKQKALDYYNQALSLSRVVGDRKGEANTLNNIGVVYDRLGEKQKALDYYNQALLLKRAVGDRDGEATTLYNIGLVYSELGEKQKTLDFFAQALPMQHAVGNRKGEANTLYNFGVG